jgi:hypothetical protein
MCKCGLDSIAQDRVQCWDFVNMVTNIRFQKNRQFLCQMSNYTISSMVLNHTVTHSIAYLVNMIIAVNPNLRQNMITNEYNIYLSSQFLHWRYW